MEKICRCRLLIVVVVAAVQMDSLTGQKTPDLVISNAVTTLKDMKEMSPRYRSRRAVTMTETMKKEIVDKHNALRLLPGASSMEYMKWNSYLAAMAADWADACHWEHGQPPRDQATLPFDPIGQNLYLTSANTINLDSAIQDWYDEVHDYNYDANSCPKTKICGHYTQVVWDTSREIGCAYAQCNPMTGTTIKSGTYLVCNYGPAGNYPRKPYTKGDVCTECPSGNGWCDNGLCRRDCTGPSNTCECKVQCANCGQVDQNTCSCSCPKGWLGYFCKRECKDYDVRCGNNPGWPKGWCTDGQHPHVLEKCPLFCGTCEVSDPGATCDMTTKAAAATALTTKATTAITRTKTTTTTTTTKATTVDPCTRFTCRNSGTAVAQSGVCKCRCSSDWQGTHCEESRAEAKIGVILKIKAPIKIWDRLWGFIQPIIVGAVNQYCNGHVSACCSGTSVTNSAKFLDYLTAAQLKVGAGYPQSFEWLDSPYTLALMYAHGAPNNALCESAKGSRKRRAVDTESALPQDVLVRAVNSVKVNLTEEMADCCNATLDAVSAAVVSGDSGESWGVAVVVDVTTVAILAAVSIATMFWPVR